MHATAPASDPDLVVYSVPEVAAILKISVRHAHSLVARGDIESVRLGKRVIVPAWALRKLIGNEAASA